MRIVKLGYVVRMVSLTTGHERYWGENDLSNPQRAAMSKECAEGMLAAANRCYTGSLSTIEEIELPLEVDNE